MTTPASRWVRRVRIRGVGGGICGRSKHPSLSSPNLYAFQSSANLDHQFISRFDLIYPISYESILLESNSYLSLLPRPPTSASQLCLVCRPEAIHLPRIGASRHRHCGLQSLITTSRPFCDPQPFTATFGSSTLDLKFLQGPMG